ncbi:MAG: N4-gp56 family major capsid protein [Planctomycetota bacterium]
MAVTTTATLTSAMQTYYDNRFLAYFKEKIVVMSQGQKRPIPKNAGKTIDFFRYHPYALVTSSGTEGTVGTEVATLAMSFTATIAVWKNYTKVSEFLELTSRDRNLENIVDLMAQNAAESLDWQTQREIALYGAMYIRGDCNSTYQFEFTAGGDVSNSSTTAISSAVFDAYCATNDVLIGSVICFTRGFNYGQARVISDFAASNGVITWETACPETPRQAGMDAGTKEIKGWFCEFRDSSATSTQPKSLVQGFQLRAVTKAVELLEKANAPKFSDGMYHGVIDPICKRQFLADSSVLLYMQSSRPAKLEKNQIGEIAGVNWYLNTMPMRLEDEPGTSVTLSNSTFINKSAGKYYVTWIFGQNAFGVVELSGRRRKILVKTPGPHTVSLPTNEYSTVGWKAYWICKALNATYAVGIITYQA